MVLLARERILRDLRAALLARREDQVVITTTIFVLWLLMPTTKSYEWGPSEAYTELSICRQAAAAAKKEPGEHGLPPLEVKCVPYVSR